MTTFLQIAARYAGQEVAKHPEAWPVSPIEMINWLSDNQYHESDCELLLRSLSDLTDGEARIAVELYHGPHGSAGRIDYLRSIGIATDHTVIQDGEVRTYTVQEQVDVGWVRLINEK